MSATGDLITWAPRKAATADGRYELPQSIILDAKTIEGASVRVATTEQMPSSPNWLYDYPSYWNGPFGNGIGATLTAAANGALPAIDGVTLNVNDRILVKNELLPQMHGIYIVTDLGDAFSPWILTRATDYDEPADFPRGKWLKATEGTINADKDFIVFTPPIPSPGARNQTTKAIVFGTTYLLFYEPYTDAGLADNHVVSATEIVHDSPPLADMVYNMMSLGDVNYIKTEHVNLMKHFNQLCAEINRRMQQVRLTGNSGHGSYVDFSNPHNRHDVSPPVEPSNLVGQRIIWSNPNNVTGGYLYREPSIGTVFGSMGYYMRRIMTYESLNVNDYGLNTFLSRVISLATEGRWFVGHDLLERMRKAISLHGDSWFLHNHYCARMERYYTKVGLPWNNWALVHTQEAADSYGYDVFFTNYPLGIYFIQPAIKDGELYRWRLFWYSRLDLNVLPDPDDITAARLQYISSGQSGGGGLFNPGWLVEAYLSDSDTYPPDATNWGALDNKIGELDTLGSGRFEIDFPGAVLTTLINQMKAGKNYCLIILTLKDEHHIPDSIGGTIDEPDGNAEPMWDMMGAPAEKYILPAGLNVRLWT